METYNPTTVYLRAARAALRSGLKTDRTIALSALMKALKSKEELNAFQMELLTEIMEILERDEK